VLRDDESCYHVGGRYVSILTGPGGPVLRRPRPRCRSRRGVSILTGPGGPVLRPSLLSPVRASMFQSSPGPEARCYAGHARVAGHAEVFQSSPGPEARCYTQLPSVR